MHVSNRTITPALLTLFNISLIASLRSVPLVAEFGLSMLFYFAIATLLFLLPSALVSAELATGWPKDGGVYVWVREAFGDRWGFFAIWMQWVHNLTWYPTILSFVANACVYTFAPQLAQKPWFLLSVVVLSFWIMTLLNFRGLKTSTLFSSVGVVVGTILPGLLIIILGSIWLLTSSNSQIPFTWAGLIPNTVQLDNITFLAGLFLAFAGLEVSAGYAGMVINPQKNYPRSIIRAAIVTLVLFVLGSLSVASVVPREEINLVSGLMDTLAVLLETYGILWLLPIIGVLLAIGALAEVNSWLIGPIQAMYTTAEHGNLPPFFQKTNKLGIPTNMLLFQAIVVTILSAVILFLPNISSAYWILSASSAQMYLLMYLLMFASAIVLRYTHPNVPRLYRIPYKHHGMWLFASIGIISSLFGLLIGFFPPSVFDVGNILLYEGLLVTILLIMAGIPHIIYQCKQPSWEQIP